MHFPCTIFAVGVLAATATAPAFAHQARNLKAPKSATKKGKGIKKTKKTDSPSDIPSAMPSYRPTPCIDDGIYCGNEDDDSACSSCCNEAVTSVSSDANKGEPAKFCGGLPLGEWCAEDGVTNVCDKCLAGYWLEKTVNVFNCNCFDSDPNFRKGDSYCTTSTYDDLPDYELCRNTIVNECYLCANGVSFSPPSGNTDFPTDGSVEFCGSCIGDGDIFPDYLTAQPEDVVAGVVCCSGEKYRDEVEGVDKCGPDPSI